jgi:hypothetical protein
MVIDLTIPLEKPHLIVIHERVSNHESEIVINTLKILSNTKSKREKNVQFSFRIGKPERGKLESWLECIFIFLVAMLNFMLIFLTWKDHQKK